MSQFNLRLLPADGINLLGTLPERFSEILDFQLLMAAEQPEFELLWSFMERVYNNQYIQLADEATLFYHEQLLGLVAEPGDSLATRRWRIINQYKLKPPFTEPLLYEILNEAFGIGNWSVEHDYPNYTMDITMNTDDQSFFNEIRRQLILIVPAHIKQTFTSALEPASETDFYVGVGSTIDREYKLS